MTGARISKAVHFAERADDKHKKTACRTGNLALTNLKTAVAFGSLSERGIGLTGVTDAFSSAPLNETGQREHNALRAMLPPPRFA